MKSKQILPMLFAAAILQGCATRDEAATPIEILTSIPSSADVPCDTLAQPLAGNCVIHLVVTRKGTDSCSIQMTNKAGVELKDLDQISLDVAGAKGNFVYWRIINSPDFRFTDDGIAFVDNNRPRMYTQGKKLNDTEYQWRRNKREARRVNGYVITVMKPATAFDPERECERDPWIRTR
jgi:hypothetical protein